MPSSIKEYEKDFGLIENLDEDDAIIDIEPEMRITMEKIHQQLKLAFAIDTEWTHQGLTMTSSQAGGADQCFDHRPLP